MDLATTLLLGAACGLLASLVMNYFMRAVGRSFGRSADMVRALGSFFTGKLDNATAVGTVIHCIGGILFGMIYFVIMQEIGLLIFPKALVLGLGFGAVHGLVTSYILMIFASERHPLEEYRRCFACKALEPQETSRKV